VEYIASAIILGAAVLCQWLLAPEQLSATPEKPVSDEKQKGILLILNIVFLLAPWVVPQMPAVLRWFLWFGFCVLTTILIQLYRGKPKGAERKVCVTVGLAFLFIASFHSVAYKQWVEEQSLATSGYLCVDRSWRGVCYTTPLPMIELGDSGSSFIYAGIPDEVEFSKFAYNVGLKLNRGPHGLEVTTKIRDKYGLVIAEIDKNHWTVKQSAIWDKNYTDSALEVLDARGQVILQIRFLPDRVRIQAEWRDEFGHGQRWSKCVAPDGVVHGCITPWGNVQTEQQNAQLIEPIFQYPSREHLGEFVKKQ
jgi:hypothetical protein